MVFFSRLSRQTIVSLSVSHIFNLGDLWVDFISLQLLGIRNRGIKQAQLLIITMKCSCFARGQLRHWSLFFSYDLIIFLFSCRSFQASLYVVFLAVLSYALIYGSTQDDPTMYGDKANKLRFFCEILSVVFLVYYLFKEIDQAER